jgi:hypothetical protein
MTFLDHTVRRSRVLVALLSTLLVAVAVLGVSAQQAGAVAALNSDVAEEMAAEYAEQVCAEDRPECYWGLGTRCRQQGRFQVTCWAETRYRSVDETEMWGCKRHVRYTAEKRPYYKRKKLVKHRKFLGPWTCTAHRKVKQY